MAILLNYTNSKVIHSKFKHIGDCEWISHNNNNDSLTFICYDHYHVDRFFNYDDQRKPCLNNNQGYKKNWIGDIAFQNCEITEITIDIIEYYRFVWQLDISDIGLMSLAKTNFNGNHGQSLRVLLASHNHLTQIQSNLFANAKLVQEVDLSFNKINRIDASAFDDAKDLQILDLSGNNLQKLENQIFENLKQLHYVYRTMKSVKLI